jgi:hypothetical protein
MARRAVASKMNGMITGAAAEARGPRATALDLAPARPQYEAVLGRLPLRGLITRAPLIDTRHCNRFARHRLFLLGHWRPILGIRWGDMPRQQVAQGIEALCP